MSVQMLNIDWLQPGTLERDFHRTGRTSTVLWTGSHRKVMERTTQEVRDYFAGASPEKGLDPLWAMLKDLIAGMGAGVGTEGYLLLLWGDIQEPSLRTLAAERNRLVLKAIEARLPAGPRPPEHTAGLIQTVIQGSCMQWLVEPEGELAAFMTKRTHMLLSVLYPDHVFG